MKNWFKNPLFTASFVIAIILGLMYFFNINLSLLSSSIEFSPGQPVTKVNTEIINEKPKNIIVFIADGMGFSHLSLALLTQQAENTTPIWQEFEIKGWHDARTTYGPLTDSGASATAMATGTPTYFEVIGQDKDGTNVENVLEVATKQKYNTGIVTDSYIWDATPAAFVAHTKSRDNSKDILEQMAASELDLLFGELEDVGEDENPDLETTLNILRKRYLLLEKSLELPDVDSVLIPIAAIYEEDEVQDLDSSPNLPRLTDLALKYLSSQDKPFVLMVESEEMDAASHRNDSDRIFKGLKVIHQTLSLILDYSKSQGETLVVFTSDHETGGLAAVTEGDYPNLQIRWATKDHTASVVPLFAKGPGAKYFSDVHRNWEIGAILKNLIK